MDIHVPIPPLGAVNSINNRIRSDKPTNFRVVVAGVVVVIARFLVQLLAVVLGCGFLLAFGEPRFAVGQVFEPGDRRAVVVGDQFDTVYLVGQVEVGVAVMA